MTRPLPIVLITLALLTAGCIATDDASPKDPGEATEGTGSTAIMRINGVPCQNEEQREDFASLAIPANGGDDSVSFEVPNGTTRMTLDVDPGVVMIGQFEVTVVGPKGTVLDSGGLGTYAPNTHIQVFGNSNTNVNGPAPGAYTLKFDGDGIFLDSILTVHGMVC